MYTKANARLECLKKNIAGIRACINEACAATGRKSSEITLMAVTKYASEEDIRLLISLNSITEVGENKVQSVKTRWKEGNLSDLRKKICLHLIGHLQTNKAKTAVQIFDSIDSIDSIKIASAVNRHAAEAGKIMPALIQVKISGSETQSGIALEEAAGLLNAVRQMKNIDIRGYMAIAPAHVQPEEIKKAFLEVKKIFDRDFKQCASPGKTYVLSLGMSGDYMEAIYAGSTMIRIGSAIFK
ncbi:MAG: YggS family pyridoxal phosphate-dependent enzyme [Elusimicrobiales bacterium]|nr:YggS family pyridoxal phosphate-dependent enzyme [Elusimicrobiales bacterium]